MRVVDLPLNATEDRIAGTIDVARALREGVKALEPGLLAEANRGILYVDEINLLDDHLADVLLDAAALGVNVVEREGLSVSHPARFLLVGTMNPEEGELRPQLADRIGLDVEVEPLVNVTARAEVIRRREAFTDDPAAFALRWQPEQEALRVADPGCPGPPGAPGGARRRLRGHRRLGPSIGAASHRADITVLQCAKALAALAGREVGRARGRRRRRRAGARPPPAGRSLRPRPGSDPDRASARLEDVLDAEVAGKATRRAAGPALRPAPG